MYELTEHDELDLISTARSIDPHFDDLDRHGDESTIYQRAMKTICTHADGIADTALRDIPSRMRALPTFEPRIYSRPDERGIMHEVGKKSYRDLQNFLRVTLRYVTISGGRGLFEVCEYFSLTSRYEHDLDAPLPSYRWVACYAVTGGSEGYYVHLDLITDDGSPALKLGRVFTIKTFSGMDTALEIAAALTYVLGA
jgi:hypothetical protein